jgi:hypothetical protein
MLLKPVDNTSAADVTRLHPAMPHRRSLSQVRRVASEHDEPIGEHRDQTATAVKPPPALSRNPGNLGKPVTGKIKLMQFVVELAFREIKLPASIVAKFDQMRPATLRQGVPFARDTVVRTWLPCRHEEAGKARGIGPFASSSDCLIRATKMHAPRAAVAYCCRLLWITASKAQAPGASLRRAQPRLVHGFTATMPSISTEI